jgi:hypothetical protein
MERQIATTLVCPVDKNNEGNEAEILGEDV